MRDFKFDMNVILRNCERFGVQVKETPGKLTANGEEFDVVAQVNKTLEIGDEERVSFVVQNCDEACLKSNGGYDSYAAAMLLVA